MLVTPLLNILLFFYRVLGGNLGVAIIALSLLVKGLSAPFMHSSLKLAQKQKEIMPELDKLKKKYGHDKKVLAEKQMALYKTLGINPASGCLTQIFPILVIFALFSVINLTTGTHAISSGDLNPRLYSDFLRIPENHKINSNFLYLDLAKKDPLFILPVLAALFQFLTSKMMMPDVKKEEEIAKKTSDSTDDVMYNMQEQMLYTMPIVFLIVGLNLPSGVVLNILVTTLFSIVQQYYVSGLGGLAPLARKIGLKV